MKKLYEYMYQVQIGNEESGSWFSKNRLVEFDPIFQQIKTAKWNKRPTVLQYNDAHISSTAKQLGLDENIVREWVYDPEFKKIQDATVTASTLDSSEIDLINKICQLLNLSTVNVNISLQNQKPGEMVGLHVDGRKHHAFGLTVEQEHIVARYAIFLEDQQLGQIWFINNDFLKWRKGDVYTWDQSRVPHGTANVGFHDRLVLVVTGKKIV